jgi:hypothetical protein
MTVDVNELVEEAPAACTLESASVSPLIKSMAWEVKIWALALACMAMRSSDFSLTIMVVASAAFFAFTATRQAPRLGSTALSTGVSSFFRPLTFAMRPTVAVVVGAAGARSMAA